MPPETETGRPRTVDMRLVIQAIATQLDLMLARKLKGANALHWCRRLNVDYERLPASSVRAASRSEAFIHLAMIRLMLRRLA